MTRYTFPSEGQRLIYTPGDRRGSALLSARGVEVTIYSDSAATTLADITTEDGDPISDSTVVVDPSSLLAKFKGPEGASLVYGKIPGTSSVFPLSAEGVGVGIGPPIKVDAQSLVPGLLAEEIAAEFPGLVLNEDEVLIDLRTSGPTDDNYTIILPTRQGENTDVTALLLLPASGVGHRAKYFFATTSALDAQTAIKWYNPLTPSFNAIPVAGVLEGGPVAASFRFATVVGTILHNAPLNLDYLWLGHQEFIMGGGGEYGILHSPSTNAHVDQIATAAAMAIGSPIDPDQVDLVKACLQQYLADGNYPVGPNFAAQKAGLAIEALVLLFFKTQALGTTPASRIIYDNAIFGGGLRFPGIEEFSPTVQQVLDHISTVI